ncbi:helix-turn-helix domain-containing protein [Piscinibacter sp. HJYY11]|uniref:AraC-like ligand-binding domain-containing protein n=1 Tax=Piscinibacter sp. HJYY11 TaxID=2801333 RepID=UPI00191F702B|nr:helix-turn-helix domain-containing protein [Piscinibacter sp. HJYY11]MBL0727470.1 helix-turn-helix domain-containing protein [Piscinibacter sp. HJYY11]
MTAAPSSMSTDEVSARERVPYWTDWINRLFHGLRSDLYGDTDFEGHIASARAGDVILTRLESNRHRVMRSSAQVRGSEMGYLKIVAPFHGCAGVEQKGREAWVSPGEWSIYDTTDTYAVSNPVPVEHLIVMVPKSHLAERGLAIDELMARRLGAQGGIARVALETMRSAWRELPGMSDEAAHHLGDVITQCVHLSLLDLSGRATAVTQREALRERIKQHVLRHLGDPSLSVDRIALALGASRRQLYNAFSDEPDGIAGFVLARRIDACRAAFADPQLAGRSITEIALAFGFSNAAHFSRVFRAHTGLTPSDFRHQSRHERQPA